MHTAICALTTPEGRKGWAMLIALGAAIQSSTFAGFALYLVRKNPMLAFWLGVIALAINVIVVTGLMVLLGVRRTIKLKGPHGEELGMDDYDHPQLPPSPPPTPAPAPTPVPPGATPAPNAPGMLA
jgi:hypothetical protein